MHFSKRLAASLLFVSALSGHAYAQSAFAVASASTEVARSPETGLVEWMTGGGGRPVARANAAAASFGFEQAARAFLQGQSAAFGLRDASAELTATGIRSDDIGRTFVRFQQTYKGVPIVAAELNVQMDAARNVMSVNGKSVGDLNISITPSVAAADARKIALRATAGARRVSMLSVAASAPSLAIHDARILGGPAAPAHLVWRVEVTSASHPEIRMLVLADAQNGRVSVLFNQTDGVAPPNATQRLCDAGNTATKVPCPAPGIANPGTSAIADVRNAFKFAENTYDFYARRFNRNSLNGTGLTLISTTRFCDPSQPCPYQNAFWNGQQMVYGQGFSSADDVVGHELSHGFTDFTSHLFYFFQSGAINEALSDIFGELMDQTNGAGTDTAAVKWKLGEDVPGFGAIRDMKNPPAFNDPDRMQSSLYTGDFGFTDNGGVHTNSGVANKTAFLMTEAGTKAFNGQSVIGIGVDKSAAIWFRVDSLLLQSGSDYADLGLALKQACHDLTGTTPKNQAGTASASGAITATNCLQVSKAVLATEMAKQPPVRPIPAEAPLCAAGQVATNQLFEKFEGATFKFQPTSNNWFLLDSYAASNAHSVEGTSNVAVDTKLEETAAITIPAGPAGTTRYLRFAHYYNFPSTAGGVVEYKIGAGAAGTWVRIGPALFANNPYNATVAAGSGTVLANQKAFSGFSAGWTSSRIKLATLAGKTVKFRFRVVTGAAGGADGWVLDDIRVYGCAAPSPPVVATAE